MAKAETKDILNDVYLTYKKYKSDNDMRAWNEKMGELTKKYEGEQFYTNIAFAFMARINEENGL